MEELLELKQLPALDSLVVNRDHYYQQVLDGYYDFPCTMPDGSIRAGKLYMPSGSVYCQPTVYLLVPDGENPGVFLEKSGWKKCADEERLFLVILEPENGCWKKAEEESVYIDAVCRIVVNKPWFSVFQARTYGAGYGKGAGVLAHHAMRKPQNWSGLLLAGTGGLSEADCQMLEQTGSLEPGIALSQVQMPVWIVEEGPNEDTERLIAYYRKANHSTQSNPEKTVIAGCDLTYENYVPEQGGTEDEEWCAKVMVSYGLWQDFLQKTVCREAYRQLWKGTCRYNGNRIGSLRYDEDLLERGFEKFTRRVGGGCCQDGSDYYCREWYVYCPEDVKAGDALPVVFLFHGAGGSGDEIGDRSGWARLAREKGILLICPSASNENIVRFFRGVTSNHMFRSRWNTGNPGPEFPSDIVFLDYLYQWVLENYSVDKSRIYACGQSSGGMMAWSCAAYRSDYFAAVAPVSAKNINKMSEPLPFIKGSKVAIMASMGTEDKVFPGGFSTEEARDLIDYWADQYGLDKHWSDYTFMRAGESCTYKDGLFSNYLFKNSQGIPMLRLIEADTKTHAIWPTESRMIWDEWFLHFKKDPVTKVLYYDGEEVK